MGTFIDLRMMFEPRQMIQYKPAIVKRPMPPYTGIASYTHLFEKGQIVH